MALPLDQLDLLDTPADLLAGAPLQLPIDAIEEDPDQPRHEFDPEGLAELAETIRERGVRQPISVRRHPEKPDRWMLNFGARRLRASKLAGKLDIPAFVDNTADSYDQVIENEQREGLKPLELALFVQRRLVAGELQADIARRIGKSRAIVNYATAMINAPEWLMAAYREGRCRGLRELYELRQAHARLGSQVETWALTQPLITRSELASLRVLSVENPQAAGGSIADVESTGTDAAMQDVRGPLTAPPGVSRHAAHQSEPAVAVRVQRLFVEAWVDGLDVEVVLGRLPEDATQVFIKAHGDAAVRSVPFDALTLRRLVRR